MRDERDGESGRGGTSISWCQVLRGKGALLRWDKRTNGSLEDGAGVLQGRLSVKIRQKVDTLLEGCWFPCFTKSCLACKQHGT